MVLVAKDVTDYIGLDGTSIKERSLTYTAGFEYVFFTSLWPIILPRLKSPVCPDIDPKMAGAEEKKWIYTFPKNINAK